MKALKQTNVKIDGSCFRLMPGCEIPSIVVEFWKKNNQIAELVKSKAISDDIQSKPQQSVFNDSGNGNGVKK